MKLGIFGVDLNQTMGRFCCMLVSVSLFQLLVASGEQHTRIFNQTIPMGTGFAQFTDTCVNFSARLSSDDFFSGLEVHESRSARRFYKRSQLFTAFPDSLSIQILTLAMRCPSAGPQEISGTGELLEKLQFKATWKTGLQTRPVKNLTRSLRQASPDEWKKWPISPEALGIDNNEFLVSNIWFFDLVIRDEKVPLTDTLVVTALSEGKQIARFAARL